MYCAYTTNVTCYFLHSLVYCWQWIDIHWFFVHTSMACDVNIVIELWSVSSMYTSIYTYHFQKKKLNILLLFMEITWCYPDLWSFSLGKIPVNLSQSDVRMSVNFLILHRELKWYAHSIPKWLYTLIKILTDSVLIEPNSGISYLKFL